MRDHHAFDEHHDLDEETIQSDLKCLFKHNNLIASVKNYTGRQGWIFLRDLWDYLVDNLEKFRQSSSGNTI